MHCVIDSLSHGLSVFLVIEQKTELTNREICDEMPTVVCHELNIHDIRINWMTIY